MTEKYIITGIVQGVGFRPNVKRAAKAADVSGTVKNIGGAVEIIASGTEAELDKFKALIKSIPSAAITSFSVTRQKDTDFDAFSIAESSAQSCGLPLITPDISVCDSCLTEFEDKNNRRYRHPFISCTACGPRYSITDRLPYDRCNITMSDFRMCPECETEYREVRNIRCHAQTIACNVCGPKLSYTIPGDPLDEAVRTIRGGGTVAVKDIGGYHLVCDAKNDSAARNIRRIKQRDGKPFAVMFNSISDICEYAEVSETEKKLLLSPTRPIVLLDKLPKKELAPSVCADSRKIGAFLPCNPVQHYLTKKCGALVMTSANLSGEPIIFKNNEIKKLHDITGGFEILSHDRRILTPLDDSVCRVICGRVQLIRRARGYVPLPINIDTPEDISVLAAGGDLKAAFCLAKEGRAYLSQYLGDLESPAAYELWKSNMERLKALLDISPKISVSDLHPGYHSTAYVKGIGLQHHFAHMASVMAEHGLSEPAIGFIFDGTGYGTDGNIWGGEIIRFDGEFKRIGGLEYTRLLGGDNSTKDAELSLDCYLISAGIEPESESAPLIKAAVKNGINTVLSSSMGRLFDAASAMLGICVFNSYEGECAIKLEEAARRAKKEYPLILRERDGKWNTADLIRQIYNARENPAEELALGFHRAIANAVCGYAEKQSIKTVILSGGVFANEILTELCIDKLEKMGYDVYINEQVPTNDGGISLGQAWYTARRNNSCALLRRES